MHPTIVRHVLWPLHEAMLRRPTLRFLDELERSQWLSTEGLRALQTSKLRRLLAHASQRSPFYAARFADAGIDPASMTLGDLRRIPAISKEDIRASLDDIVVRDVAGGLFESTTGGSTGEPLRFYMCRDRQAADQAARARTRRWFGIEPGSRELYLWGSPVELRNTDRFKRLRDRLTNHLLLDAFDMSPRTMDVHLARLDAFDPAHVFGYPSSLATLSRHAMERGRSLQTPSLKAVFTTGEVLAPADRAAIEETLSVPVVDGYGSREAGFIAHQCPEGAYHVTMESVIVELLDDRGEAAASGEIVVTHLDGRGMPLVRYRTGDRARRRDGVCECGRGLECLERIEGRLTDSLRRVDGGTAHALSVIYVLRDMPEVRQFRIEQRADMSLDVEIVADDALDPARQARAKSLLSRQLGGEVDVRISRVPRIAASGSGKHRYVVSQAT
ncbi:MAG: phenylacetate--CoA ligase family protein [Phycisphaerales bacterium]|nr:phenylacetate--CoA ligase family protein [Phycisphaerales bacterium]MCB9857102.1 phenylacetate--CoA ligase family protein [Phycisphaerales bacterium]MCB9861771.1 phenylacetate--CoA ligase family protein [Phycisphaerales bacterium]